MPLESVAQFVDEILKSGILHPDQVEELEGSLRPGFKDACALAWYLHDLGWMTTHQINQISRGNTLELVVGDYILLEPLGQGGAGKVFKARRASDDQLAALKVIRPDLTFQDDAIRQFEWEIRVVAQLDHPNIVRTLEAGRAGGHYFFAMEFLEGMHLGKLLKRAGLLPAAHACSYIRQAALGLHHAHQLGLIHRDIKPANLFLALPLDQREKITAAGWTGVASSEKLPIKILDWGLASLNRPINSLNQAVPAHTYEPRGTADYSSPEQAIGAPDIDIRSDIYSLGCTLYYLLSGGPPFPGGSIMQKLLRHQQTEPLPLHAHRRDVSEQVIDVVKRMMAKRPGERYQSPLEVAEALEPLAVPTAHEQGQPPMRFILSSLPDEKRNAIRHTCKLDSSCRPAIAAIDVSWPTKVIDISRGGVGLLVERRFEPGALLEVDLQSVVPHFKRTLLVRVQNIRKQPDGLWILGAIFPSPLSDEELWALRSERVRPPAQDSRAWLRVPSGEDAGDPWHADILNISPGGVCLLVPGAVDAGARVRLELQGADNDPPLLKLAFVVHGTAQPEGGWLIGCAFAGELSEQELQSLT
jgi:serine/threonine-protein kinase